jgi:hypothetical protein
MTYCDVRLDGHSGPLLRIDGLAAQDPMGFGGGQVSTDVEVVVDGRVAGKETLRRFWQIENPPSFALVVVSGRANYPPGCSAACPEDGCRKGQGHDGRLISAIAVSDDRCRLEPLVPE